MQLRIPGCSVDIDQFLYKEFHQDDIKRKETIVMVRVMIRDSIKASEGRTTTSMMKMKTSIAGSEGPMMGLINETDLFLTQPMFKIENKAFIHIYKYIPHPGSMSIE